MLTESDKTTAGLLAEKWKVSPDIHPDDYIFQFVYQLPKFASNKDAAIHHYFNNGWNSASQLSAILKEICKYDPQQNLSLLEFASGYGCVTRHLKNVLPSVKVTACDIHAEATNFIKEKLHANAILSASVPEQFSVAEKFDVVFALSFFSHMPHTSFERWLKKLASLVQPGGYLIFTTHGFISSTILPGVEFDKNGFWFRPRSEQKDLRVSEYGMACTLPKYVFSRLFRNQHWSVKFFQEGYWWTHQDLYVVKIQEISNVSVKRGSLKTRVKKYVNRLRGRS
jgi:2-polyprenyl-3-methyl-5-hydroxy-6-metoxy-1,4-benzoquinol methylase